MKIPNKYKCIPFWSWNEEIKVPEVLKQIKWFDENGVGGYFMHARTGLTTEYLGKDWFKAIKACSIEGQKRKMEAYAYDENGWPSGFAGGSLLNDPNNCDTYLTFKYGKYDSNALVSFDYKTNKLKRVKTGKDVFNIYLNVSNSTVDICQKEVVKKFIKSTYEKYYKNDKEHLLKGFFTDEPQLYRWGTSYSRALPKYFNDVYHEDILDRLGLLFLDKEGYRDFRYKYRKALHLLMLDSYAKQIYEWCDKHDYKLTGHYVEENGLGLQIQCCGGIMPMYEYEHIPGCDWLTRNISSNGLGPKAVSSVAAQLGKEQVICEMFAGCGWDSTPLDYKHIAEFTYLYGVNLMCQHLVPYTEKWNRKRDWPGHFSPVNPWVKKSFKEFNDYFTELGYHLAKSREIVHAAMLVPIRSCYFNFNTFDPKDYGVQEIDIGLDKALNLLDNNHIQYHLLDETILAKHGSVNKNKLKCGLYEYDYLILPKMYTMDKETEVLFHKFIDNGGKILLLDEAPTYLEGEKHDYPYLKSNTTLEEIKKSYPFTSDFNTQFRVSYRIDKNKKPYLFILNLGEEGDFTIKYNGYKNFHHLKDVVSPKLHFLKYESKIVYPTNEEVSKKDKLTSLKLGKNFEIIPTKNNYLTIDNVSYSFDNKKYSQSFHHAGVFLELLNKRYDGDVYLKYEFDIKNIPSNCSALIEDMNNKEVTINGHEINKNSLDKFEHFYDEYNIQKYLKIGHNEIIVKIHYYQDKQVYYVLFTENVQESLKNCLVYNTWIEPIYLKGDFGVYGNFYDGKEANVILGENFYLDKQKTKIQSLIKDGYPFLHGDIKLKQTININSVNKYLELTERFHYVEVYVNKKHAGNLMFSNKLDLSKYLKQGKNEIELVITISNRNTYGPFHFKGFEELLITSPYHFEKPNTWKGNESSLHRLNYSFVKTII